MKAFYFQHDYDPLGDPKLSALVGEFGAVGYGLYWRLVEMLHTDQNHKLPHKRFIYVAIAKQMLTSVEQVEQLLCYAIDVCELFESDGELFWSNRVMRNIEKRAELSKKRSVAGKMSSERRQTTSKISTSVKQVLTHDQQMPTSVQQNPTKEKKEKESKVKEIKEIKEIKEKETLKEKEKKGSTDVEFVFDVFDDINDQNIQSIQHSSLEVLDGFGRWWELYDKKVGKQTANKLWKKLNVNDRSAIMAHTALYRMATEKAYRKNPETYLRQRAWEDEIIKKDDNGRITANTAVGTNLTGYQHSRKQQWENFFGADRTTQD